ncbi:MAG: D-glycerate dehydrogenase [Planctomycetota bacterium]
MTDPKPVVVVTREVPGDPIAIDGADVVTGPLDAPTRADTLERIRGASVVITMFTDEVDTEFLDAAGDRLRGVCNFAVGYNNIDLDACKERGIVVTNTPDAVTEGTANMAIGLLLAVARRIVDGDRFARSGEWVKRAPLAMGEMLGLGLAGRTIHIVGAGRIGYATALRARAFGMGVIYTSRRRKLAFEGAPLCGRWVALDSGLREADVVSLHTPLTGETRYLLNADRLAMLKPDAIVINTSRGPVVDEAALVEVLRDKKIWGAGLDVFEDEPKVHPGLVGLDNVVMMPHVGSGEIRWRNEMTRMCEASARAILAGEEPEHRVM